MTRALHKDITSLVNRIEQVTQTVETGPLGLSELESQATMTDVKNIKEDLRRLLDRIDSEIPLLQLAITASGETLSTSLPSSISPSRLLQASTLLVVGDIQFSRDPTKSVHIGPVFYLSMYMLFQGHAPRPAQKGSENGAGSSAPVPSTSYGLGPADRKPLWQEVVHKARVCLHRIPLQLDDDDARTQGDRYQYQLSIVEDREDGRAHEDNYSRARQYILSVREVSKLFYTDSGRILNLGHEDPTEVNPVLLLKRDSKTSHVATKSGTAMNGGNSPSSQDLEQAAVDRQLLADLDYAGIPRQSNSAHSSELLCSAPYLDPDWIAFEIFHDDGIDCEGSDLVESSDESGEESMTKSIESQNSDQPGLSSELSQLEIPHAEGERETRPRIGTPSSSPLGAITTSLSLLEMLIRLASLQEFQQTSHLAIPDHVLTFFLEETSGTGLVGESQRNARTEAKNKVGFDPYTDQKG